MKKIAPKLFILAVTLLTIFGQVISAGACAASAFQPEVPSTLRK